MPFFRKEGGDLRFVEVQPAVPAVDKDLLEAIAAESGLGMEKHNRQC